LVVFRLTANSSKPHGLALAQQVRRLRRYPEKPSPGNRAATTSLRYLFAAENAPVKRHIPALLDDAGSRLARGEAVERTIDGAIFAHIMPARPTMRHDSIVDGPVWAYAPTRARPRFLQNRIWLEAARDPRGPLACARGLIDAITSAERARHADRAIGDREIYPRGATASRRSPLAYLLVPICTTNTSIRRRAARLP
jgi:hypothetical protein